ncbi:MAG: hypothetical protein JSV51_06605 [Candidatus Bathyarchaeota archaeon]|nr:MAG: hypothetical protein JSV51_06605 [Candidatus Bathyarchaeota archaeon]
MNSVLLQVCKELIDDAKTGSADLVFKGICLEILAHANHVLSDKEYMVLVEYTTKRMQEKHLISIDAME